MDNPKTAYTKEQLKILRLLAAEYPSIALASATLVNLNALSNLPKGTEHFMSDLHGEERGQHNCPYHFGVDHQAAIIDGKVLCKHLKRKEDE